jgi:hypothetical protein
MGLEHASASSLPGLLSMVDTRSKYSVLMLLLP